MKNLEKARIYGTRQHAVVVFETALIVLVWAVASPGQMGMGDSRGVVQQRLKPPLVRISGKLQEIKTHPCENTTGKAELGTHLILKDRHGRELNIHLGPASAVSEAVKQLKVGGRLDLLGFRTGKMAPNQYVAKTLILANHLIKLRNPDLRPYWSDSKCREKEPLTSAATTKKRIISETAGPPRYYTGFRQRRRFQDWRSPPRRRRCRGRIYGRQWQWDN